MKKTCRLRQTYYYNCEKNPHRWDFTHDEVGYNYRMPNINAALGCAQLEQIDEFQKNQKKTINKAL
ncbi:DegT/DnrJ/EryC1/StrS family aminotransferase [Paenibacillus rhizoplanae]